MLEKRTYKQGFTLIEMLIVIALMAILALIAFPSYQRYATKARLEEGRTLLNQNYLWLDKMYNKNSAYRMTRNGAFITTANLPYKKVDASYTFSIKKTCSAGAADDSDAATFCLIATPDAKQATSAGGGKECGTLMVDQSGQFQISVNGTIKKTPINDGVTCF